MKRFCTLLLAGWVLVAWCGSARAEAPTGILFLRNTDQVQGAFRPGATGDTVIWQGSAFTQPFEFDVNSLSNIKFPRLDPLPQLQGELAIELSSGDVLTGNIVSWAEDKVRINTPHFGELEVAAAALRRVYRLEGNSLLLYPGLTGLGEWKVHAGAWNEDGAALVTSTADAMISADIRIPEKAVIEFELGWEGKPNFAFVVGAPVEFTADKRQDGFRFEMWDQLLGVLREHKDIADVDRVTTITKDMESIHLLAYLDQRAGLIQVYSANGTLCGQITVPPGDDFQLQQGVRLINRVGTLKLQRLRVSNWNGQVPTAIPEGTASFQQRSGETVLGLARGLDAQTGEFLVQVDGQEKRVAAADMMTIDWKASTELPHRQVALNLQDSTRVSGSLAQIEEDQLVLASPDIQQPLAVPFASLQSLLVSPVDQAADMEAPEGRQGVLDLAESSTLLHGVLIPGEETEERSCYAWHPLGSRTSSPLKANPSGHVVYRTPNQVVAPKQVQVEQQLPGLNFANLFQQKARNPAAPKAKVTNPHAIHLRAGGIIPANVTGITEEGVHIESSITETTLIPGKLIKAIEFQRSQPPSLKDAKKARLLTIPRLQKASPPTHLMCSETGDFLRCRILSMNAENFVIEVQLEEMTVPRDRVAQLIWFHPEETPAGSASGEGVEGQLVEAAPQDTKLFTKLCQVLQRNGERFTFDPTNITDTHIHGTSDVLGKCQFPLDDLDQIVFGDAIAQVVADLPYSPWVLTPAIEPLAMQDDSSGGGTGSTGTESPLVGKPAPEINLELLEGGRFNLQQLKGKVVVLDFWASWCGPCIQTMPLVEEAMQGFDEAQVKLVSVNLEESAQDVKECLERHELHVSVALDTDGVAARRYQANAIPQLVIVDQSGNVAKLFIGGGEEVVEQLKAAVQQLLEKPATPDNT